MFRKILQLDTHYKQTAKADWLQSPGNPRTKGLYIDMSQSFQEICRFLPQFIILWLTEEVGWLTLSISVHWVSKTELRLSITISVSVSLQFVKSMTALKDSQKRVLYNVAVAEPLVRVLCAVRDNNRETSCSTQPRKHVQTLCWNGLNSFGVNTFLNFQCSLNSTYKALPRQAVKFQK